MICRDQQSSHSFYCRGICNLTDDSDVKQIITQLASTKAIPLPKMQCTIFSVLKNHLGLITNGEP